jgi:hypothetical protein
MRILLDSNILIPREHEWIVPDALSSLLRAIAEHGDSVLVHPSSLAEIAKYHDVRRRNILLSKLASYPTLSDPPVPDTDQEYAARVGKPRSDNDVVDNRLLYAVYRNAVDLLVTEDHGIHAKSGALGCNDRVITIVEGVTLIGRLFSKDGSRIAPASVRKEPLHNINLADSFFDSMRADYPEFDSWFTQKARDGRKAWVHRYSDGRVAAFMLLKQEEEPVALVSNLLPAERRVKICTIKVSRNGLRIGELLLKIAFEYAHNNSIETLYLTAFESDKDDLVSLITRYGFMQIGRNGRGEAVYFKRTRPVSRGVSRSEIASLYYPSFYDGTDVKKYVVPIQPVFHQRLFPAWKGPQRDLNFDVGMLPERNAITKAYLCNSRITGIGPQDILLFYRSEDTSGITTLGVVERVYISIKDVQTVLEIAGKRIVYSQEEIEGMLRKHAILILFRWHVDFPRHVPLRVLVSSQALRAAPQSIIALDHGRYLTLKREGQIEDSIAVS